MKKTITFWFTGLSGSGKTTIVEKTVQILKKTGKKVKVYDGDAIRAAINKHLTFTPEHIIENNKIIAGLCLKDKNKYDYIFVPLISPFHASRKLAKEIIGDYFFLIYVKTSLKEAMKRDPKGLYKRAISGQIANFIGIDPRVPFQPPRRANLVLNTEIESVQNSVKKLISFINLTKRRLN